MICHPDHECDWCGGPRALCPEHPECPECSSPALVKRGDCYSCGNCGCEWLTCAGCDVLTDRIDASLYNGETLCLDCVGHCDECSAKCKVWIEHRKTGDVARCRNCEAKRVANQLARCTVSVEQDRLLSKLEYLMREAAS